MVAKFKHEPKEVEDLCTEDCTDQAIFIVSSKTKDMCSEQLTVYRQTFQKVQCRTCLSVKEVPSGPRTGY